MTFKLKTILIPSFLVIFLLSLIYVFNSFVMKDNNYKTNVNKQTKNKKINIIATLGKDGYNKMEEFCKSGANIFRINGSHIKSEQMMQQTIDGVMKNIKKCKNSEVMYDTQGPEIRVLIPTKNKDIEAGYEVQKGDIIFIHTNLQDKEVVFSEDKKRVRVKEIHIGVNYQGFINDAKKGKYLTIENRTVVGRIENIDKNNGTVKVAVEEVNAENGIYKITDRRHINLFGASVSLSTLTENDKKYIKMSVQQGVKYLAVSFVRNEQDIAEVRQIVKDALKAQNNRLGEKELTKMANDVKIIAKFETLQGLRNIEKIMKLADGSMIARGDLSSEIPIEEVPYAKDLIIKVSNKNHKMCILATDVLESLMRQSIPSKNDVDVIATSLKQGVDVMMLSNETAQSENANKAISFLVKCFDLYNQKAKNGNIF